MGDLPTQVDGSFWRGLIVAILPDIGTNTSRVMPAADDGAQLHPPPRAPVSGWEDQIEKIAVLTPILSGLLRNQVSTDRNDPSI